jgi:hypothetical protein
MDEIGVRHQANTISASSGVARPDLARKFKHQYVARFFPSVIQRPSMFDRLAPRAGMIRGFGPWREHDPEQRRPTKLCL